MTATTTAMPSMVAMPEISISQRTRATIWVCAGLSGSSSSVSGLFMGEVETQMGAQAGAPSDAPIVHTATIGAAEAGQRLDRALAAFVNDLSRSRLDTLIFARPVAIRGRPIPDPSHHAH